MTCFSRNISGSVTPAVCILTACVVLLNFVMVDMLRIYTIENITFGKQRLAAESLLSLYDTALCDRYGIYALYKGEQESLENRYYEMLTESSGFELSAEDYPSLNIMNYDVTGSDVVLEYSLGELSVLKEQISEYMKYKGVANVVTDIASQISSLLGITSVAGVYGKYIEVSVIYDDYKSLLSELDVTVNGSVSFSPNCVNGITQFSHCIDDKQYKIISECILGDDAVYSEDTADKLLSAFAVYTGPAAVLIKYNDDATRLCTDLINLVRESAEKLDEIDEWTEAYEGETEHEKAALEAVRDMASELRDEFEKVSVSTVRYRTSCNSDDLNAAFNAWNSLEIQIKDGAIISADELDLVLSMYRDAYGGYRTVVFNEKKKNRGKRQLLTIQSQRMFLPR